MAMAHVCRERGYRDLLIPVGDVAECIPKLASKVKDGPPACMHAPWGQRRCAELSAICTISDSGFVGFFCEKHAEEKVVRLP